MSKVLVIGSSNTDMVVKTHQFPQPGETLLGGNFFMFAGGKGANQAVAAARLGGSNTVTFVAKVGQDLFGRQAVDGFRKEQINTNYIVSDPKAASGVALITVNEEGENMIVVAPGANHQLSIADIDQAHPAFVSAHIVLLQLETPLATVEYAIEKCRQIGRQVILNPAPAQVLSDSIYPHLSVLTPNETEAEFLTGIKVTDQTSASKAAGVLVERGVKYVIITMGAKGAFFKSKSEEYMVPAPMVNAVDTTGAGDVFNGALAIAIAEDQSWQEAIRFACKAAAIAVTRMGAQAAAPYRKEL